MRRGVAEPGELCPVEFDLRLADQLIDVKIWVGRQQRQSVGLGYAVNIIRRDNVAGAGHVLDHDVRIAGNTLSDMRRDHARVNVVDIAGLAAGNNSNRLALIVRRLRGSVADRRETE